jgi:dTDP-4-dehydrorhamnose 3,5-epimerase
VTPTSLPEVLVLQPTVFRDERGVFFESFNARDFKRATGLDRTSVQDNHGCSVTGVLRGLHYQIEHAQGKLVRVIKVRRSTSPSIFGEALPILESGPEWSFPLKTDASYGCREASPTDSLLPVNPRK